MKPPKLPQNERGDGCGTRQPCSPWRRTGRDAGGDRPRSSQARPRPEIEPTPPALGPMRYGIYASAQGPEMNAFRGPCQDRRVCRG